MVLNISRHLAEGKLHALDKHSVEYKVMLKAAKPYTGMGEIQVHLSKPDSPSDYSSEDVEDLELEESDDGEQLHKEETDQEDEEGEEEDQESDEGELDQEETDEEDEEGEEEDDQDDDSDDDNDSNCPQLQVKSQEYFTDHRFKNNRHRWLVGFFDYLSRPSAGNKKDSIRLQHASQVQILLEFIDPGGDDITCLAEDKGDAVWQRWVRPTLNSKSKNPGTIISYLTSFEKFLKFVTNP